MSDEEYNYQPGPVDSPRRQCDSCGYPAPLKLFGTNAYASSDRASWLCRICAFTPVGSCPLKGIRPEPTDRLIAWTANAILDAIKTEAEEIKRLIRSERHGD